MSSLVRGGDECRDSTSRNCLSDKGLGAGALSLSRLSFGREAGGFAGFRGDACLVLTDGSLQRGQDYGRVSAVGSGVASVGRLVWPRVWNSLGRPQRPSARDMTSRRERVVPTQCECTSRWDRKCELEKASHWHPSTRQRVGPRLCWRPKVAPPQTTGACSPALVLFTSASAQETVPLFLRSSLPLILFKVLWFGGRGGLFVGSKAVLRRDGEPGG